MNLTFNQYGDVEVDEKGLLNSPFFDSEIARFAFFFDCKRGGYKYSATFGNNSGNLIGLSGVNEHDIQLFNTDLRSYLESSGLLLGASVAADFIDDQTIEVTIIGGGDEVTYRYSTSKGRLYNVTKDQEVTDYNYLIHSADFTLGEVHILNIEPFINKLKEVNNIGKYEDIDISYRIIRVEGDTEGDVIHSDSYLINPFEGTLTLQFNYIQGDIIRLQGWPADTASLESTDNPYLLRRNL